MNPPERIDSWMVCPAEIEPDRVGLLFARLELEQVADLAREESQIERPALGVDGLGKLLPEFRDRRRDGTRPAVDRDDGAGAGRMTGHRPDAPDSRGTGTGLGRSDSRDFDSASSRRRWSLDRFRTSPPRSSAQDRRHPRSSEPDGNRSDPARAAVTGRGRRSSRDRPGPTVLRGGGHGGGYEASVRREPWMSRRRTRVALGSDIGLDEDHRSSPQSKRWPAQGRLSRSRNAGCAAGGSDHARRSAWSASRPHPGWARPRSRPERSGPGRCDRGRMKPIQYQPARRARFPLPGADLPIQGNPPFSCGATPGTTYLDLSPPARK